MDSWIVNKENTGVRIDKYISNTALDLTRSYIQKLIKDGHVYVNKQTVKSNYKVKENDCVSLDLPEPEVLDVIAENIPLDIIYEDDDVLLVNKPKGMVVHPAAGHYTGTLVNAIMYHCKDSLSTINGVTRPGIVHRIDRDTTGLLIICKNDKAHNSLAEQLKVHSITRKYYAIVWNNIKEESGVINAPIGRHPIDRKKMAINYKNGKEAITHFKVLERFGDFTLIECKLETGRTHQIRVHMASIGHPLLGDEVYGPAKRPYKTQGQALHAGVFGFIHPSKGEYMVFKAPLPQYFEEILDKLRKTSK